MKRLIKFCPIVSNMPDNLQMTRRTIQTKLLVEVLSFWTHTNIHFIIEDKICTPLSDFSHQNRENVEIGHYVDKCTLGNNKSMKIVFLT